MRKAKSEGSEAERGTQSMAAVDLRSRIIDKGKM